MKKSILFLIFLLISVLVYPQDIQKRLIIFGDAGEINAKQEVLISYANDLIINDSTFVFFLGDNVYPNGMGLEGIEKENGIKSLRAQFESFRKNDIPVFFLAGNHDWNVSRPGGLEKLEAQQEFLKSLEDDGVSLIPHAGTLGPVSLNITSDIIAVAYDSEYWLYPYHASEKNVEEQKQLFARKLAEIFETNKDKMIIMLSHHPMVTYGEHSLSFGWKQHLFPLTRLNKNFYLPLPLIGSLYPLWRGKIFNSAEDLPSPEYQSLVKAVMKARVGHQNVVFAAGHDHGLQFIEKGNINQIVSGSGSKTSFILDNKHLKYKYQEQGFCTLDCMTDSSILISYYIIKNGEVEKAYETMIVKQ